MEDLNFGPMIYQWPEESPVKYDKVILVSAANRGRTLDDATFDIPVLTCACHGYSYDLRRAGASVERPELRLESLPSKVEDDKVKVAFS